ncbi:MULTISPECIES: DUF2750 domain-containing protein [Chryseobacterium]|uniref:DUF2750 domain-containing protein n=1 Tax=Chryseobacterium cucumeris TaxID=1813611 RepID=A0ABX9X659_9FLAO|nr:MULTISPECIES: DUF2750 domain-containing protein [Chryseobacterium]MDH5032341.1 DUF2750 domain-containing protein [Chryseobacterium cucumeris]QWT85991.1 DUF2750 domain-containing protein [Chryseobacterium sp. PCH239]ROH90602.1 DUF2750 domain-containing protein [Chryseobacterium cucumeris]
MNQKEIESVIALEPTERYKYFIKQVADSEIFYTLIDTNGDYVVSKIDDEELFPLWSAQEYAELCKVNGWENCEVKKLDLDDLEDEIIDFVADNGYLFNVFPAFDKTGFVVDLTEFSKDLSDELKNYG